VDALREPGIGPYGGRVAASTGGDGGFDVVAGAIAPPGGYCIGLPTLEICHRNFIVPDSNLDLKR
jgi:hypothetical protein